MPMHTIRHAIDNLARCQPLPQRLAAAYRGLEIVEYAARELMFLDSVDSPSRWRDPQRLAAYARGELARAPSFPWPLSLPPPVLVLGDENEQDIAVTLTELAEGVVLALVEATTAVTHPADRLACMNAAAYASDLHVASTAPDTPEPR